MLSDEFRMDHFGNVTAANLIKCRREREIAITQNNKIYSRLHLDVLSADKRALGKRGGLVGA